MHRPPPVHDKKYLWFHNQNLLKFFQNIPIIPLQILTHLPYFSIIQCMNTHMINQILLPLLLMESTPQGIPQKDTVTQDKQPSCPPQGTAYQGTDTRPQHPHTDILPYKPPNCRKRVVSLSKSTI